MTGGLRGRLVGPCQARRERGLPAFRYPDLRTGTYVRVVNGPLRGCEGILLHKQTGKCRLVVAIDMIQQAVCVEINEEEVEPTSAWTH